MPTSPDGRIPGAGAGLGGAPRAHGRQDLLHRGNEARAGFPGPSPSLERAPGEASLGQSPTATPRDVPVCVRWDRHVGVGGGAGDIIFKLIFHTSGWWVNLGKGRKQEPQPRRALA